MGRNGRILAVVGAIVVVAVLVGAAVFVLVKPTYQTIPRIPTVPTSTQEAAPPEAEPSVEASPPVLPDEPVAQSMPTHLKVWKDGEAPLLGPSSDGAPNIDSIPVGMGADGTVVARGLLPQVQEDSRLPWAVRPGKGVGTSVLVCHALAGANPPYPCNGLTQIPYQSDVNSGYFAEMVLPTGVLTGQLVKVHLVPKDNEDWTFMTTRDPRDQWDRWFITMCDLQPDQVTGMPQDTLYTRVLEFRVISSKSA